MELFSPSSKNKKKSIPRKIYYMLGNGSPIKIFYIFSKENFSDILENESFKKSSSYFRRNLQSSKKQNLLYISKKSYEKIFLKILSDNSFHLFYKLNQTILLVHKNIESFFCLECFFQLLDIFY